MRVGEDLLRRVSCGEGSFCTEILRLGSSLQGTLERTGKGLRLSIYYNVLRTIVATGALSAHGNPLTRITT